MRISVPSLIEKLRIYKPKLVCFVGKGIWDKFEDIVTKACHDSEIPWIPFDLDERQPVSTSDKRDIKFEEETTPIGSVTSGPTLTEITIEDDLKPLEPQTPSPLSSKRPRPSKIKQAFDWTQPRAYKLVHQPSQDRAESVTLFWVVPSTSGLERTPVRTHRSSRRLACG
jgi:hypothetical protein